MEETHHFNTSSLDDEAQRNPFVENGQPKAPDIPSALKTKIEELVEGHMKTDVETQQPKASGLPSALKAKIEELVEEHLGGDERDADDTSISYDDVFISPQICHESKESLTESEDNFSYVDATINKQGHSSTSVNGTPPSAVLLIDTWEQLVTQCTGTSTDSTPISISNNTDLPRPTVSSAEQNLALDSNITASTVIVDEKLADTENFSQPPESVDVTHIPDFRTAKVDATKFPPKHYDLYSLEIGTWKYERKNPTFTSRLKVLFCRRKFVYEFQLNSNHASVPHNQLASAGDTKQMACIEVPFRTVVGISASRSVPVEVILEIDTVPAVWVGKELIKRNSSWEHPRYHYNTDQPVDLTGGQLFEVRYHKLTISSMSITTHLMRFDPRFSALLKIPIKVDGNKTPPEQGKIWRLTSAKRKRTEKEQELGSNPKQQSCIPNTHACSSEMPSLSKCMCSVTSCSTRQCSCVKDVRKCQGCRCDSDCKNPLNILEKFGVDLTEAKNDCCFMQAFPKIYWDLVTLLQVKSVPTPCCGTLCLLRDCCIGRVACPSCKSECRYSWCLGYLCDEENQPRNHCEICQTCRDYREKHCFRCNKCYFAGSYGIACPCLNTSQQH